MATELVIEKMQNMRCALLAGKAQSCVLS